MPTPYTGAHVRNPEPPGDETVVIPRIGRRQEMWVWIGRRRAWVGEHRELVGRIGRIAALVAVFAVVAGMLGASGLTPRPASATAVDGGRATASPTASPTPTIGALVLGARSLPSANASATPKARPSPTRKLTTPPRPEVVGTPIAIPTPTASGTPAPLTLQDYLKLIPSFPAAPAPVKVTIPHPAGQAAWVANIPTTAPVAFLTIDDGWYKEPITGGLISQSGLPFTAFLTIDAIQDNVAFFQNLQSSGMVVEDHTISHPDLTTLDLAGQENEICGAQEQLATWFGRTPTLFRPPYISFNSDTQTAAASCGFNFLFDGELSFGDGVEAWSSDRPSQTLQAGDIVILHFDPSFPDSLIIALNEIKRAGLTPALLENWINLS